MDETNLKLKHIDFNTKQQDNIVKKGQSNLKQLKTKRN